MNTSSSQQSEVNDHFPCAEWRGYMEKQAHLDTGDGQTKRDVNIITTEDLECLQQVTVPETEK
jgi:hypothetical protein